MAELWDSNFHIAEQWYDKAIVQRDRKHYEKALVCFDRALALAPKESEWWYWKGVTLCNMLRYDDAIVCFDRSLEIAPDDVDSADYRAYSLLSLDRTEEALATCERALALIPTSAKLWFRKGIALRNLKRDEEALACFDSALEFATEDMRFTRTQSTRTRAAALFRLQRYEEALSAYDDALALVSPDDRAVLTYWKGASYFNLNRYDEALMTFEQVLALNPEHVDAWRLKGITLRALGHDGDVLACFERAVEIAPENADAAVERADTLFRLGRFEEVLSAYEAALALAPADDPHEVNYRKARTLQRLNRDEEALAAFDKALTLHEDKAPWWIDRSISCEKLKRYEEELANAEKAIALDESNGDGWKLKGYALTGLGRDAEALTAFEQALQRRPTDSQTWSNKANCLYRLGRFDEALATYDEAVCVNPDDADLRKNYAWAVSNIRRTTVDQRLRLRDGRWLGYLDYGDPDGTPIIYCHGAPGSRLEYSGYDELLKELSIRLIAPDRPGYGLSDFQPHRRLLDWPTYVEQLADHLGIERFAVLGVSGGGPHAAACAYTIPQRLTRVGLVSSAPPREFAPLRAYIPRERISQFRGLYFPWPLFRVTAHLSARPVRDDPSRWAHFTSVRVSSRVGESFKSLLSRIASSAAPPLAPVAREQALEPFRQGMSGYTWDTWIYTRPWGFRPGDIHNVEVYLWHGELDPIVPVSAARALAAAIPGCRATYYPDEGHTLNGHIREILTAMISGTEREQSDHETGDSP